MLNVEKKLDKNLSSHYNEKTMGGLYSHQKVLKRRYLSYLNIRRSGFIEKVIPAVGGRILRSAGIARDRISRFLSDAGGFILQFIVAAGKKIFKYLSIDGFGLYKDVSSVVVKVFGLFIAMILRAFDVIKSFFLRFIYIIRYNTLFHRVMLAACFMVFIAAAGYLVYFAIISPELPPENMFSTMRDISENSSTSDYPGQMLSFRTMTTGRRLPPLTIRNLKQAPAPRGRIALWTLNTRSDRGRLFRKLPIPMEFPMLSWHGTTK